MMCTSTLAERRDGVYASLQDKHNMWFEKVRKKVLSHVMTEERPEDGARIRIAIFCSGVKIDCRGERLYVSYGVFSGGWT